MVGLVKKFTLSRLEYCPLPQGQGIYTLYLPQDAPANSLGALSRFLEQKGCHLQAEYGDNPGEPVLRIALSQDSEALTGWIKNEFPAWQRQHRWPNEAEILLAEDFAPKPLTTRETEFLRPEDGFFNHLRSKIGHWIGPWVGSLFMAGNVTMLASSVRRGDDGQHFDPARMASSLLYIASSAIVMANSSQREQQRPLSEVVSSVIDALDDQPVKEHLQKHQDKLVPWAERIQHAIHNKPWEVKAMLDLLAGGGMIVSGLTSKNRLAAGSALLGMGSILAALTPPRYREPLLSIQWVKDKLTETGISSFLDERSKEHSFLGRCWDHTKTAFHWLQENTLSVSGLLGALSSFGYMLAGRTDKAHPDAGLAASGAMFFAANVLKSFAVQKTSFNLGDVSFAASNLLSPESTPPEKIHQLAVMFGQEPEVTHRPSKIEAQTKAMLDIIQTEGRLGLENPDRFLQAMPWNEVRKRQWAHHPAVPKLANEEAAIATASAQTI